MTTYNPNRQPDNGFNQPSPGTAPKVIKGLAKKGVPRPVTGPPKGVVKPTGPTAPTTNPFAPGAPGVRGVVQKSSGGRIQAKPSKRASSAAAAAANAPPVVTPPVDPSTLSVEDAALQGNYDPNQFKQGPGYGGVGSGGTDLASQFNAQQYGKAMAGMQYDPAITSLAMRIKGLVKALPGSLDAIGAAFHHIDNANALRQGQVGNAPAGSSAAQYQGETNSLAGQRLSQQAQSNSLQEADFKTRAGLLNSAAQNDAKGQLTGLTSARGAAQVGYTNQGIKTKSDLVAQAISNINSMRASNTMQALAAGQLEGQGLTNEAKILQNTAQGQANLYAPYINASNLTLQGQTATKNAISIEDATKTLKLNAPAKTLKQATSKGPAAQDALAAFVIPQTAISTDPTTGATTIHGNPNDWVKSGANAIMSQLPNSKRANVIRYINTVVIPKVLSPAGGWTQNKNGKWVNPNHRT